MKRMIAAAALTFSAAPAYAQEATPEAKFTTPEPVTQGERVEFQQFLAQFRQEALSRGYPAGLLDSALSGVTAPDPVVVERSKAQPEFVSPVWEYLNSALSADRVDTGTERLSARSDLFDGLEQRYQVDRETLTAVWGLESAFGAIQGDYDLFRSLLTLAWEGWREDFVNAQLYAALDIIREGEARRDQMKGSWAGAMGQTQFIPATYRAHAEDYNGDGLKDIWTTEGDALGSAAHYLSNSGWDFSQPWGEEIRLTDSFDWAYFNENERLVSEWDALGVKPADNDPWSPDELAMTGRLVLPAGSEGPGFLVFENFDTIMRYNNSTSYALAVGLLSDAYAGRGGLIQDWPSEGRPLRRVEVVELQEMLTQLGHDTGDPDGMVGPNTRSAVRSYQRAQDMTPDGYVNSELLDQVRADAVTQ